MRSLRGVTFIELILAVSIFAIVAVAVYSTFSSGISAWRSAKKAQDIYQDIYLTLEAIASDLENSVQYYSEDSEVANFSGEENEISFYSLIDIFQTTPVHPELKKITYRLEDSTIKRLELAFAESAEEDQESESEEIALNVSGLNFFYNYREKDGAEPSYRWENFWKLTQKIPQGVKIELKLNAAEAPVFTKYVFIPHGEQGPEQEIE